MKLLLGLWLVCALFAQTLEEPTAIQQAHKAYDDFAKLANIWSTQHDDLIASRADSARLDKAIEAFEKFRRLAKEAHLFNPKRKPAK